MRSSVLFAAVWIGLFSLTAGFHKLSARSGDLPDTPSGSQDPYVASIDALNKARLETMPRQWHPLDASFPRNNEGINKFLAYHREELLKCRDMFASRTNMPREFFEFSFQIQQTASTFGLSDVRVERSTIALTEAEQSCFTTALQRTLVRQGSADATVNDLFSEKYTRSDTGTVMYYRLCLRHAPESPKSKGTLP